MLDFRHGFLCTFADKKSHFKRKIMSLAAVAVRQMRKKHRQQQLQQQHNNTDNKTLESPEIVNKENLEVILHSSLNT